MPPSMTSLTVRLLVARSRAVPINVPETTRHADRRANLESGGARPSPIHVLRSQPPRKEGTMAKDQIRLSQVFPVDAQRLYDAWLDSAEHTAFTGSGATVEPRVGGRHTAW